ncbi:zinc finger protein 3-like [Polypterus senegalus]|uniref:zinc finger protein 3-like n=1 Tax=Polypterus senegalus TaxID=55291 RepID=UPI001963BF89|nr:zinc finger protein 3-like [Polypterus senegalus]
MDCGVFSAAFKEQLAATIEREVRATSRAVLIKFCDLMDGGFSVLQAQVQKLQGKLLKTGTEVENYLAFIIEETVLLAVEVIVTEFTDHVEQTFSYYQRKFALKEKEIDTLKLQLESQQRQCCAERDILGSTCENVGTCDGAGKKDKKDCTIFEDPPIYMKMVNTKDVVTPILKTQELECFQDVRGDSHESPKNTTTKDLNTDDGMNAGDSTELPFVNIKEEASEMGFINIKQEVIDQDIHYHKVEICDQSLLNIKEEFCDLDVICIKEEVFDNDPAHLKMEVFEEGYASKDAEQNRSECMQWTRQIDHSSDLKEQIYTVQESDFSLCPADHNFSQEELHNKMNETPVECENVKKKMTLNGTYSSLQCGAEALWKTTRADSSDVTQEIPTAADLNQCNVCNKMFKNKWIFQLHQRIHTGEEPYFCSDCGKTFKKKRLFLHHQKIHLRQKPYSCTDCEKRFSTKDDLQKHKKTHSRRNSYYCSQCGKCFSDKCSLQEHQKIHNGKKPYCCSECGKSFVRNCDLQKHLKVHLGQKPYCCKVCTMSFSDEHCFQKHQTLHIADKPYCTLCKKTFSNLYYLQLHQVLHTGEKPFCCTECGKKFSLKTSFIRHQKIHM